MGTKPYDEISKELVKRIERLIRDVVLDMHSDNIMDSVRLHDTKEDLANFITNNIKLK